MRIVSEVYSEVGKALVNAGLGFFIAVLIAGFFTKEPVEWWKFPVGIAVVFAHVFSGAWLIQISHQGKDKETRKDG